MSVRLEELRRVSSEHHDRLVSARKDLLRLADTAGTTKEEKLMIQEINRVFETCTGPSKQAQKILDRSQKDFANLVKSNVREVTTMAEKKVAVPRSKRKRDGD
jgi:hypothetical protein